MDPIRWNFLSNALSSMLGEVAARGSALRQARLFHPQGIACRARVEPFQTADPLLNQLARRLEGEALVRFSGALWKLDGRHGEKRPFPDVLGISIRFRGERTVDDTQAEEGDQDLLLATIRSPWTTLLAPFSTDARDFLRNDYYAVSPFEVDGFGRVKFRVTTPRIGAWGAELTDWNRRKKLVRAIELGQAVLRLELRQMLSRSGGNDWRPLAEIRVMEVLRELDQEALRFSPFRAGAGIKPRGFVHALRARVYPRSQESRPSHRSESRRADARKRPAA